MALGFDPFRILKSIHFGHATYGFAFFNSVLIDESDYTLIFGGGSISGAIGYQLTNGPFTTWLASKIKFKVFLPPITTSPGDLTPGPTEDVVTAYFASKGSFPVGSATVTVPDLEGEHHFVTGDYTPSGGATIIHGNSGP